MYCLYYEQENPVNAGFFLVCGEGGIRTLDTLLKYTHFPGVLFRPLRHLSVNIVVKVGRLKCCKVTLLNLQCSAFQLFRGANVKQNPFVNEPVSK
jgi:hypothetical protein